LRPLSSKVSRLHDIHFYHIFTSRLSFLLEAMFG
jgi:hypothetical protein